MKPIKPSEVAVKKKELIPDFVIGIINELIVKHWNYKTNISKIEQFDIIECILLKEPTLNRQDIFNKKWLDIQDVYCEEGWNVEYVKPTYFEDFTAYFIFKESNEKVINFDKTGKISRD